MISGVGVGGVGRDDVRRPAEQAARADPKPRCDDEPQDAGRCRAAGRAGDAPDPSVRSRSALLIGEALVLGFVFRRALGLLCYLLHLLLSLLDLLLCLVHDSVAGLAHHLVLLARLGDC